MESLTHPVETRDDRSGDTLLLVEDEEFLRSPLVKVLRKAGYTVLEAASGENALQVAESYDGPINLVVTDLLMPGMSGKGLVERLGATRPGMKVLYISGHTENEIVHQGMLEEGVQLLTKPFTIQELLSKVAKALRTRGHGGK